MNDPFAIPDDHAAILADIWTRLIRGSADRRSPFHTPVVTSMTPDGPDARVMVLRKTDRATHGLRFHTDGRSRKVAMIVADPRVGVIGYDAGAKIQLRLHGRATIATSGADVDAAWASTGCSGRRSYMTTRAPGSASAAPTSGLPDAVAAGLPTLADTEPSRANFALVNVTLDRLEWLHLAHDGHRRAAFVRAGDDWTDEWLIP